MRVGCWRSKPYLMDCFLCSAGMEKYNCVTNCRINIILFAHFSIEDGFRREQITKTPKHTELPVFLGMVRNVATWAWADYAQTLVLL